MRIWGRGRGIGGGPLFFDFGVVGWGARGLGGEGGEGCGWGIGGGAELTPDPEDAIIGAENDDLGFNYLRRYSRSLHRRGI